MQRTFKQQNFNKQFWKSATNSERIMYQMEHYCRNFNRYDLLIHTKGIPKLNFLNEMANYWEEELVLKDDMSVYIK